MIISDLPCLCPSFGKALTQVLVLAFVYGTLATSLVPDGFMVDWVRPTQHQHWLKCEREMYRQLLGEQFPASGSPPKDVILEFDKRALDRAWQHVKGTVHSTRRVIVWTRTIPSLIPSGRFGMAIVCSRKWTGSSTKVRR